jgi:hypothetical protein
VVCHRNISCCGLSPEYLVLWIVTGTSHTVDCQRNISCCGLSPEHRVLWIFTGTSRAVDYHRKISCCGLSPEHLVLWIVTGTSRAVDCRRNISYCDLSPKQLVVQLAGIVAACLMFLFTSVHKDTRHALPFTATAQQLKDVISARRCPCAASESGPLFSKCPSQTTT